jgi:hypothetical protein
MPMFAKTNSGSVTLHDSKTGAFQAALPVQNATSAIAVGEDVVVTLADGRVAIYDQRGLFKSMSA